MTEIKLGKQRRDLTGDIEIRAEADVTRLSFPLSSEVPVDRWYGTEILAHTDQAIRLTRIAGGAAPLLFNHNWDDPIGMIDSGRLKDGRLYVDAHLFDTDRAREVATMIRGGLRNVSIGYEVRTFEEDAKKSTYTATDWEPLEGSIVTIPADASVGIGRSNEQDKPVRIIRRADSQPAEPAIKNGVIMTTETTAPAGAAAEQQQSVSLSPVQMEERRKSSIANLCRANKLDERFEKHWIGQGASLDQVSDELMQILAERSKHAESAPALLGMTKKEVGRYSLLKALRASANKDWTHAGLELEAHKAVMNQSSRAPRGPTSFFVPLDVQTRDMTAAGVSGSNYLVSTDNLAGSFINLLANRSVVMSLGATRLSGLTGNITIPRETAGVTAYWLADETTAITESQPTVGQLALSPKNIAALTEFTHQLMQQSSPQVEEFLMRVLARDVALAVDVGALRGTSANGQPTGITQTASIGTFTVDGTDTIGDLLDAQTDVAVANALSASSAYVTTHAAAALLMKRQRFSSTDTPLWEGNVLDGRVLGFRAMATNQMASGTMIFGDFAQLIIAEWGVLELMINPFSDFTRGYSQIRAWYTCDIGVRYAGAFSYAASVS